MPYNKSYSMETKWHQLQQPKDMCSYTEVISCILWITNCFHPSYKMFIWQGWKLFLTRVTKVQLEGSAVSKSQLCWLWGNVFIKYVNPKCTILNYLQNVYLTSFFRRSLRWNQNISFLYINVLERSAVRRKCCAVSKPQSRTNTTFAPKSTLDPM